MALSDNILASAGQYRQARLNRIEGSARASDNAGAIASQNMQSVQQFQQQLKVADFQAVRQRASLNATKFAQMEQQELKGQAITWGAANPDAPLSQVPVHLQPYVDDAFNAQRVMRGEKRVADEDREKDALAAEKAATLKADADWMAKNGPIVAEDPRKLPPEAWATMPATLRDNMIGATGTERRFGARQDILEEDAAAFALLDAADTEEELLGINPASLTPKASAERERRIRARRVEKDRATDNARADMALAIGIQTKDRAAKAEAFREVMRVISASQKGFVKWSMAGSILDEGRWAMSNPGLAATLKRLKEEAAKSGVSLKDAHVGGVPTGTGAFTAPLGTPEVPEAQESDEALAARYRANPTQADWDEIERRKAKR